MTVTEVINRRRSIRRFLPDQVPSTIIREILAIASQAPSISNRQMWRFIVLEQAPLRNMLVRLVERKFDQLAEWPEFARALPRLQAMREHALHFANAPTVIVVVNIGYRIPVEEMMVQHGMRQSEVLAQFSFPEIQSIGAMIAHLLLVAEEHELAACWNTDALLASDDLQAALEIPSGESIAAMISIGYPAEHPLPRPRKAIDEMISWR